MDDKSFYACEERARNSSRLRSTRLHSVVLYAAGVLSTLALVNLSSSFSTLPSHLPASKSGFGTCRPPQPPLLAHYPPLPHSRSLAQASSELDRYLSSRAAKDDIDSISIAVITPNGPIFERSYGVLKANESGITSEPVDKDSIYRIASITKMFTVLETLVLRERGVLNWDDPVTKFLPNFTFPSYGWAEYLRGEKSTESSTPITLRQLASHMSGVLHVY
jgi:CubicO group peptidase (beta-lactamase class C family)